MLQEEYVVRIVFDLENRFRYLSSVIRSLQLNPELTPCTQGRFKTHLRAHTFHRLAHDSQADASSLVLIRRMNPLEQPENAVVVFRGYADAIISKPHANPRAVNGFRRDLDARRGPGRDEFCGIVQKVGN